MPNSSQCGPCFLTCCSALTNINIGGGTLLALGGVNHDIHAYNPSTKSWMMVGSLPQACSYATGQVIVTGRYEHVKDSAYRNTGSVI